MHRNPPARAAAQGAGCRGHLASSARFTQRYGALVPLVALSSVLESRGEWSAVPLCSEFAGGDPPATAWSRIFYDTVLRDPLLQPLFGDGQAAHVEHLTMFTAESFGGPARFTAELAFAT